MLTTPSRAENRAVTGLADDELSGPGLGDLPLASGQLAVSGAWSDR